MAILFYALPLLLISITAGAGACAPPSDSDYFDTTAHFAADGIGISQKAATSNIFEFCKATTKNQAQHDFSEAGFDTDKKIRDSGPTWSNTSFAWISSEYPEFQVRMNGFLRHPELSPFHLNEFDGARAYLKNPHPLVVEHPSHTTLSLESIEMQDVSDSFAANEGATSPLKLLAACNELVLGTECAQDLKKIISVAKPRAILGYDFSMLPLFREVLDGDKYDQGLRLAALKVIDRVQYSDVQGANILADLTDSFKAAGNSVQDAEDMAWKTLGLISTGGASISPRLFRVKTPPEADGKKVAITVISSLAPVLDSLTFSSGHAYEYPPSVTSSCDSGKPYHFWLTAYFARDLTKAGSSAKAASAAAFTAQKGYEMFSSTTGRHTEKPFTEYFLSHYSNSIRVDLAYSSAGALFGARAASGVSEPLNVDEGIRRIVNKSQSVGCLNSEKAVLLTSEPIRYALRWNKLFAPDSAYFYFQQK